MAWGLNVGCAPFPADAGLFPRIYVYTDKPMGGNPADAPRVGFRSSDFPGASVHWRGPILHRLLFPPDILERGTKGLSSQ
jgi:hypothetical protein